MATESILFDTEHFPLIYIGYPRPFSHDDWDAFLARFDEVLDRQEPFGWLNDARTSYLPNARNRAAIAAHQARRATDYRRWVKGVGTISSSALVRGIITAIEWIHPAPFPHDTFATPAEAERYVRKKMGMSAEPLTIAPNRAAPLGKEATAAA
jgi:hypothetical protein